MTFLNFNLSQMSVSQGNPKYSIIINLFQTFAQIFHIPLLIQKRSNWKLEVYSQKELGNLRAAWTCGGFECFYIGLNGLKMVYLVYNLMPITSEIEGIWCLWLVLKAL